jgi:hypothetical protein
MRISAVLSLLAALSCNSPSIAAPRTFIVLPVGPGGPGNGPYEVEAWPDGGCKNCSVKSNDFSEFQRLLTALSGGAAPTAEQLRLPVHAIHIDHGVILPEARLSFSDLQKQVGDCALQSTGILSPDASKTVAFGVQIACDKTQQSSFISVVMGADHAPATVYWMPDGPIHALNTAATPH